MCRSATVLLLDLATVAENARFEGVPKFDALVQRTPCTYRGSKLALLKSTFNTENFICRLSWSIASDFDAVHS